MQVAGDNRPELEKVLSHYRDEPLKLRAARFLIENMDAHYCYGGKAVDGYYHDMDSLFTHKEGDRGFWNTQYDSILNLYRNGMNVDVKHRLYDVAHLKSDFLIASIDSAFNVWRRNWNKQYGFDVFCRYVLPYRVGEERPDNWRAEFAMSPGEVADYERYTDNYSYAYNMANTRLQWIRSTIFILPVSSRIFLCPCWGILNWARVRSMPIFAWPCSARRVFLRQWILFRSGATVPWGTNGALCCWAKG